MKAIISYSLFDQEQYIITLLSKKLRESGFSVITSNNIFNNIVDFTTHSQITSAQLFVGIISNEGVTYKNVLAEWQVAVKNNVPNILLVEDSISISSDFRGNYVRYNRNNPQPAIQEIHNRMLPQNSSSNNDAWGWIIGGAALLAIVALLAGDSKK